MKKTIFAMICVWLLSAVLIADNTETGESEAKYYDNAKVIRIKTVEGEGFVQRSYEEGYEEATANLPLFEKDTVGTTTGRLEIYLGRMNYLRLDADSRIELVKIPQLRQTELNVRVEKGGIYLDIENLDSEKSIEIQTPDCGVFLLDKGVYRINVNENSLTEVFVYEGTAEVAGQENSRNVRENQKIVMSRGELKERPYYFYASEKDDFDRWNEKQNRELGYARNNTSRYLQNGYEDYEYEMSRSGRWSYMSDFNSYVWLPYNTAADWMPYANGRWVWNPYYGYVWTSYDACGWFTHHYGRWHWDYAIGWYWIPAYHWSPAWVSWFWDDYYYGWCPLSWWNRPIIIINNRWDHHYQYRHGMPHHSRSTIIIRKHELAAVNMMRVALNRNANAQSSKLLIAYHGAAPSERLTSAKLTVINARGKAVTYKQNSIISTEKYRIVQGETDRLKPVNAKDSVIRDRRSDSDIGKNPIPVYKSKIGKSSNESSVSIRSRKADDGSIAKKPEAKTISKGKSASSDKPASTGTVTKAVKKKKDGSAYLSQAASDHAAAETTAVSFYANYRGKYSYSDQSGTIKPSEQPFRPRLANSTLRAGNERDAISSAAVANVDSFSNRVYQSRYKPESRSSVYSSGVVSQRVSSSNEINNTPTSSSNRPYNFRSYLSTGGNSGNISSDRTPAVSSSFSRYGSGYSGGSPATVRSGDQAYRSDHSSRSTVSSHASSPSFRAAPSTPHSNSITAVAVEKKKK